MILRRGGGAKELAIRVQNGTVQPAGSAGMLWVNTATPSNHWAMAVTAPAAPATGDLWVRTDAASANVVELLRKNSVRINVLRVMQYDGSSWQAVEAHYYDGTDWTQLSNAFNPATDITYTGTMTLLDDGGEHWRVKFLTSGVLTVTQSVLIDAFLVGGGGGGGLVGESGGGGGAGYTATYANATLTSGVSYVITIGSGGSVKANGGNTSISVLGYSANGGIGATSNTGGAGGSGGGSFRASPGYAGGSDGSNGLGPGGTGQGTTTREFAETTGALYAGGGGGGVSGTGGAGGGGNGDNGGSNGTDNTGGGGGFNHTGGSGIVVIRDQRAA